MDMNFVIFPPSATFHGVGYSERKQKKGTGQLLHFDNFGHYQDGRNDISKKEFEDYLRKYSARNKRTKNAQFHATITCKGKQFTHEELKDKALLVMEQLGYSGIPILVYGHNDTRNNHIHIVTSRIGLNGRKINHNLEGMRANKILATLLKLDTKDVFKQDVIKFLEYNFSSVSQFNLLMEINGYSVKDNSDHFEYFKHGMAQGKVDKAVLTEKIKANFSLPKKLDQLKAIIAKYAITYSTEIKLIDVLPYSSADRFFESELTKFLKEKFGYEFCFFSGKGKDKPYGYAIIDQKNKTVYKGSEVYKLNYLMNILHFQSDSKIQLISIVSSRLTGKQNVNNINKNDHSDKNEKQKTDLPTKTNHLKNNVDIISLLTIDDKTDANNIQIPQRKKRKKNNFF